MSFSFFHTPASVCRDTYLKITAPLYLFRNLHLYRLTTIKLDEADLPATPREQTASAE